MTIENHGTLWFTDTVAVRRTKAGKSEIDALEKNDAANQRDNAPATVQYHLFSLSLPPNTNTAEVTKSHYKS